MDGNRCHRCHQIERMDYSGEKMLYRFYQEDGVEKLVCGNCLALEKQKQIHSKKK